MINNDILRPAPSATDIEIAAFRLQVIANAYAPEDCESCEVNESTCRECATDALEEAGFAI